MRIWRALSVMLVAAWLPGAAVACAAQPAGDPSALLRAGQYEDAIASLEARVSNGEATPADYRGLVTALSEVGRYRDAIEAARSASELSEDVAVAVAVPLGRALHTTGRSAEAEAAFRRAATPGSPHRLIAELHLAILQYERGQRDSAMAAFDRFIDYYNTASRLTGEDLTAVATAVRYLGQEDPLLFQDALRAYDEAIAEDPNDVEPRLLLGEMFLQKYNSADAQLTFREILDVNPRQPRALLGVARVLEFDGDTRAVELARAALDINPNLVPARVFLARLHMGLEAFDDAIAEIERALEVNPSSLEALSVLASIHYVRGEVSAFERVAARILEQNPRYGDLYATIAELCVQQRRYRDAVDLARRALELDPKSWHAHGVLGINLLRVGEIDEGRASLETAFAGDPYDVWIKNTLDLLDTFDRFQETRTERFHIVIHERESALLAPYVAALAEEAFDRLSERYGAS
ncbi:MAG TPA: tetratricopeptide repeat protein, partial [Longimicrobiales bacterium]|nr:tetratricopeptide repeat protein [Longimicrobiales bacterium]